MSDNIKISNSKEMEKAVKSGLSMMSDIIKEIGESDKIDKTLEFTTKVKGAKQSAKEIKEVNDQISSLKKNLKDSDITEDMYKKSTKLNDSIKENTKVLDELYEKAKSKDVNLKGLGKKDTEDFFKAYYTAEQQLSKMGEEMPKKYKKAFQEIQRITDAVIEGTSKQTDDYYDISLSKIKSDAIKRTNRSMSAVNAEIKAQDKARRDAEIAELESRKESVKSKYSSGNAIENLRKLNELGLTDEGDIDRSKIIFQNLEQCEKVIKSIKDNISKISSEDSEENLDVLESANFLLSNLEKSAEKLNNLKFFDTATSESQKNIENLWNKKKFNEEYKIQEEDKFKELRQSVDDGTLSAEEAIDEYNDFCKSLIRTNEVANTTASTLKTVNKYLREGIDSNGDYKTFEDIFQMGDLNDIAVDKLYEALQNFKNLGIEGINLVSDDELDRIDRAEGLLEILKAVQRGHVDYTADYEAHHRQQDEDFFDDYTDYEDNSAESGRREAETFDKIEESAEDAAEAKQKFVEANKEVFDSIVNTLKWLGDEDEGFRKLAENLGSALGQFGDFASSSNFSNFIEALDKIIEKIDEVANKTGKIGLNLNVKEDSSMEVQQAAKATDAYYASILKNMRNKANKLQASGLDIATLLFNSPEVSDVGKRYGSLTEAQEALKLGTIDKADRTNEENARAYLQYFEQLRIARDNVKDILEKYRNILKTGVDSQGKKISEDDKTTIKQMITDYENQWSFLLSPRALPAYTITQVAQDVNKINGVTSRGKQSAADKKRKAGNTIAEMLGIDSQDTEATNLALEKLSETLNKIKDILITISQKDVFGELLDEKSGKLDVIGQKIVDIIQKVKELNQVSSGESKGEAKSLLDDFGSLSIEEKAQRVTEAIKTLESTTGKTLADIIANWDKLDDETKESATNILSSVNLINENGEFAFSIASGGRNTNGRDGIAILTDDFAILQKGVSGTSEELTEFMQKVNALKDQGVNVAKIFANFNGELEYGGTSTGYQIQERIKGDIVGTPNHGKTIEEANQRLSELKNILSITDEEILKLLTDWQLLNKTLQTDANNPSNFIHNNSGFNFIDLGNTSNPRNLNGKDIVNEMMTTLLNGGGLGNAINLNSEVRKMAAKVADKVGSIAINAGLVTAEEVVEIIGAKQGDLLPLTSFDPNKIKQENAPDFSSEAKEGMESYAKGVKEGEPAVKDSVTDVMKAGEEAGMEALDEHSPSVIYRIMGQNSIEGYILGVKDKEFELIDTVGKVLKSGFLNSDADAKWLSDWWEGLVSKDTFSIEQVDLLPNSRQFATEAFNADIRGRVVEGNNLVDVLKSTALVTRDVAKANRERAQSEKELSTEVERVYEGEFEEEGRRSNRNMKRTKTSNDLYEYEEEISPGRTRRFQRRRNRRTGTWVTDEIISTDYDKLVSEAVDATVKLTKAQHNLELEQAKQRPNIDLIIEYNNRIREAQERLDRATLSAASFAQETAEIVNTDDPRYDTKYVMGMFNDAVNEQSAFKLSDENIRYYSKLRNENEATQRSIDATTRALAGFESQVRAVEYSYDQSLAPGLTKPVTKKSDLDELAEARNNILGKIDDLKGRSATVEEITEIRKLISEYQLLARAKRDANNVVDKNLGGDTLEVKVSKQIANIDKLIAKSEQYGDKTEDITKRLKDQKQTLQNSILTDLNTGEISTNIEAKDFYKIQSEVKILGSQLDSNIVKIKEEKELVNEYLEAFTKEQKALNEIEVLKEKGEVQNKNAIEAKTKEMEQAAEALRKAEDKLKNIDFDFTTIEADENNIIAEKGNIAGKYYDQVNAKAYKGLDTDLTSIDKIIQNEEKYTDDFITKVKILKAELESFTKQDLDFNEDNAKSKLEEIKLKISEIKTEAKSDDVQLALDNTIEKTKLKIAKFIDENSAMTDEYRSKLKNLEIRLDGADLTKAEVNDIVDTFIRLETEITKAGQTGKSFFSTIKDRLTGLNAQLIAQYLSFQDMIRYAREAFNVVQELNIQMVELAKVSEQSLSQIEADFNSYANTAKDLGSTISDTISATADWARMGYNVPDAKQLAEVALLYKNVGDGIDITAANQSLISTLQGYQMQADEAEHIVDVFNEVANNYAIDTAGIGEALQRSASSLNAANTSLEQSVALVTAANTVVQNPESVGTTFKTLSARLRGAKTDLAELGEEEDEFTQTTSKLQNLVKSLTGFDILESDQKTFKSIYDIIVGIGKEWKNLTDIERASLGEALAGKRNANTLFAILDNIDTLTNAYETAENAAGSAQREQENFEKGIEYSVNKAKASLQELAFDALDSDLLKGLVDTGTKAIDLLDKIIDKFGLLKTLIVGVAGIWGSQKLG